MATRTIRLKLVVPRGDHPEHRRALWTSHAAINEAARYYERQLLLMRQEEYDTEAGVVSSDDISAELQQLVTKAQQANGKSPGAKLDEAFDLLRKLYELIVPSALEGESGSAQEAGGFVGPLTDPKSEGYLGVFAKLDRLRPNWEGELRARREQVRADGDRWLKTDVGQTWIETAKKTAKWLKQREAGNDAWPQDFLKFAEDKKKKDGTEIPSWVADLQEVDDTLLGAADAWLETPTGETWMRDTGRKAAWRISAASGDRTWPLQFIAKLDELEFEATTGAPPIVKRLRELGVLPLFHPYITPQIYSGNEQNVRSGLTPWDRLAFRLAVGHLLSWESWCHRAANEHAARIAKLESYRVENLKSDMHQAMSRLDEYERERSAKLSDGGLGDAVYRIRTRGIRGWSDLWEKWNSAKDKRKPALMQIAAAEQTRLGNKFGDHDIFAWLAEPKNHVVWYDDPKPLQVRAVLNVMQGLVDRSKERALLTQPDARLHPVWVQWEPLGGANLKNYDVGIGENGQVEVQLPLLQRRADGLFDEKTYSFPIAPSGQLRNASFSKQGKAKHRVSYDNDAGETHQATLQSSDLYLRRRHLEHRKEEILEDGDIGSAYFKFVIDVDPQLPAGWGEKEPAFLRHFRYSKGKKTGHESDVKIGSRVLSVDLGLRVFAACSVFELKAKQDAKRLSFAVEVENKKMFAVHERSFQLKLPGETVGSPGEAWRRDQEEQMRTLRRALFRYRSIMNLALEADAEQRRQKISELHEKLADEASDVIDEKGLIAALGGDSSVADAVWAAEVKNTLAEYRKRLAPLFRDWRVDTKSAPPGYVGKSMWAVEYFTNVRRLLQSWSLLGRETGEIRRADRDAEGTFAYHLLQHLDGIKEDRLKTGADLIVQASRGFIRGQGGKWSQVYAPCEVVLFEDLSRYRMRTDRPRRENSQLMKWAHRQIPEEVKGQGELFGVHISDTSAQFSSRYCAKTGAPGIRARRLTADDIASDFIGEALKKDGLDPNALQPGDLVPWRGGSRFVAVNSQGHLSETDADINAAQNLQRRFWRQHGDAFRMPCKRVNLEDGDRWVPSSFGERMRGALGGTAVLIPTGHDIGSCKLEKVSNAVLRKLRGEDDAQSETAGDEELEALAEELIELSDDRETYFRDPSGVVLPDDLWYPSKIFWSIINNKTRSLLAAVERH